MNLTDEHFDMKEIHKNVLFSLLLWIGMYPINAQVLPPVDDLFNMQSGWQESPLLVRTATFRNEGLGPLDSIKVWDNLTGKLVSMEAFTYDKAQRVIQKMTYTLANSFPYRLEQFAYPGNDTLIIRTSLYRKYFVNNWTPSYRNIQVQVDSPNTQTLELDWDPDLKGWLPFYKREEVYNQNGSLRHRMMSSYDQIAKKWITNTRDRPIYNSKGRIEEYLFESDYDQNGVWDPNSRWAYEYIQDTLRNKATFQLWNSTLNEWINNLLVKWEWTNSGKTLIRQDAKWGGSIWDWDLYKTRLTYRDDSDRIRADVRYDGQWLDHVVPTDSFSYTYNQLGEKEEEIYHSWDNDHWEPVHMYRYGLDKCSPFPGRLDSVWALGGETGWELRRYEACRILNGASLIVEVDSISHLYSWEDELDMKVHYYYLDSTYVAPPPIDSSSLQDCIYMNPYQPGSPITCFANLGLPVGIMNVRVVNLLGQLIHEDRVDMRTPFFLPDIPQGLYAFEVSIPSGPTYSGLIQITY